MTRLIIIFCLFYAASAQATIYRWVNAQGNVVFSDVPPPNGNAKKLELGNQLNTIQPPPSSPSSQIKKRTSHPARAYRSFTITSPANNEQLRANNGNITVSMTLTPALHRGDHIRLFMDGVQVYNGSATQIPLANIDRGTHTLYAVVESQNGTVAIRSNGISFTVLRDSILFNPQHNQPHTDGIHQAPRAPMMPRAPQFHYPN